MAYPKQYPCISFAPRHRVWGYGLSIAARRKAHDLLTQGKAVTIFGRTIQPPLNPDGLFSVHTVYTGNYVIPNLYDALDTIHADLTWRAMPENVEARA